MSYDKKNDKSDAERVYRIIGYKLIINAEGFLILHSIQINSHPMSSDKFSRYHNNFISYSSALQYRIYFYWGTFNGP